MEYFNGEQRDGVIFFFLLAGVINLNRSVGQNS